MAQVNIIDLITLTVILYFLLYISNNKDHFGVSLPQKTKQCSKDDINNAYKEYIFETPKFIRP